MHTGEFGLVTSANITLTSYQWMWRPLVFSNRGSPVRWQLLQRLMKDSVNSVIIINWSISKGATVEEYRRQLGRFGVSGDLALQSISSLSGGQKSRVAFTAMCYPGPNFLVLDEPTNHLDVETIEALSVAIQNFGVCPGTPSYVGVNTKKYFTTSINFAFRVVSYSFPMTKEWSGMSVGNSGSVGTVPSHASKVDSMNIAKLWRNNWIA